MPRYKLTLEYDGTGLAGWQRQNGQPSVQEHLEEAIQKFCGAQVEAVAAGRTDAGVHAIGQVTHVDLPQTYDPYRIMQGINFHLLPQLIAVVKAEVVSEDFHARFDAARRLYLYRIANRSPRLTLDHGRAWHVPERLDAAAMHEAAQLLLGNHDFTSFRSSQCQSASPVKTLERFNVERQGEEIRLYLSARSFLHHQVRNLAGTLRLIGNGKWNQQDLLQALAAKDRSAAGETAPPWGLYFSGVEY